MGKHYQALCEKERRISLLASTKALLEWDQQCFMPEEASEYRAQQSSLLAGLAHQESVSRAYEDALKAAEDECSSLPSQDRRRAHLRLSRREFDKRTKLPQELVEQLASAAAEGQATWEHAKKTSDFPRFAPVMEKIVHLTQKKAGLLRRDEGTLYDVLLKDFEFGVSSAFLQKTFGDLKTQLIGLLEKILIHQSQQKPVSLTGSFPEDAQKRLGRELAESLGFDAKRCVLTGAMHPFSTTLGKGDYRITSFYPEHDPLMSFLAIAHEMGHSLYEQGLPKEDFGTMIGEAASYGIHESQSLFWEKRIANSPAFLKRWFPKFHRAFPQNPIALMDPDDFVRAVLFVQPSLIRVSADEVTYPLHIMIRFELEKALLDEGLAVKEIPKLWNQKYKDYLGVEPSSDAEGCLQDVHWSCGAFGYFPSYALGHLYSAQFSSTFESEHGSLNECTEKHDFVFLRKWLGDKIHRHGAEFDPLVLIEKATGKTLSPDHFVNYLEGKYL